MATHHRGHHPRNDPLEDLRDDNAANELGHDRHQVAKAGRRRPPP